MWIAFKNRFHDNDVPGMIIAGFTGSNWIHCELIDPDAGMSISSWVGTGGVAIRPTTQTIRRAQYVEIYDLGAFDTSDVATFLKSQLGKGYDWRSIFLTYGLRAGSERPDQWTCAELVYQALTHTPVKIQPGLTGVTPGSLREMIRNANYTRIL
ncbi:hypothetical protein [Spirosoma sp. 48-14]|uniref:hypothetical protein n=1 Tax=Spirosoma sp. 48-14 TaxID=1895854 RepID=UPI000968319A|nr:hypothetical protein [Spirosoma sp. 48-14]OJW76292.1 MAG: hypothetical protein BGO59_22500 [Spirosoma sp. 48-14]